jgi:hypothetical protein
VTTAIALIIIIATKFLEGAWLVIFAAPAIALVLIKVSRHYKNIARVLDKPLTLQVTKLQPPVVIIPIHGWDCIAEKAVRMGLLLSDEVVAVHVRTDKLNDDDELLKMIWSEKVAKPAKAVGAAVPRLVIINTPYRQIYKPILRYISKIRNEKPDRLIAIVIPELIEAHWYENLLHNIHATGLRTLIFLERDQRTVVITTPWYLHDKVTLIEDKNDK